MTGAPAVVVHEGYTSVFTINATGGHLQETYLPKIGSAWYSVTAFAFSPPA